MFLPWAVSSWDFLYLQSNFSHICSFKIVFPSKILLKGHLIQGAPRDLCAAENSPSHPLISVLSQNTKLRRWGRVTSACCFWDAPGPHQASLRNTKQKFQVTWINNQRSILLALVLNARLSPKAVKCSRGKRPNPVESSAAGMFQPGRVLEEYWEMLVLGKERIE